MAEYKVSSYTVQGINIKTFLPSGNKKTMYCIMVKTFPFPNKSISVWDRFEDGFRTEEEAIDRLNKLMCCK